MIIRKTKILPKKVLLSVFLFGVLVLPLFVNNDFASAAKCGETDTFFDWKCDSGNPIPSLFVTIFNWLTAGVVVAVIGGIIYGAIMYSSSGGNPSQAKQAIGIIRNAVIALLLFMGMWAILNFLVPGGLFEG